jgi:hypothetical protein
MGLSLPDQPRSTNDATQRAEGPAASRPARQARPSLPAAAGEFLYPTTTISDSPWSLAQRNECVRDQVERHRDSESQIDYLPPGGGAGTGTLNGIESRWRLTPSRACAVALKKELWPQGLLAPEQK